MVASQKFFLYLANKINIPNSAPQLSYGTHCYGIIHAMLYTASWLDFNEHFENACQQDINKSITADTTL